MARESEPVSNEEIEALREEMESQRHEIREALAEDLGRSAADFDAETYLRDRAGDPVADGGDE